MKTKIFFSILLSIFLLSCSKDKPATPDPDINNLEGYFLFAKNKDQDGSPVRIYLFEFRKDKKVLIHTVVYPGSSEEVYEVIDDHTLNIPGTGKFTVEINNGRAANIDGKYYDVALIKAAPHSRLDGKKFRGVFYSSNGTVLHHVFFYSFEGNRISAGFDGPAVRTGVYTNIGNFAAIATLPDGYKELLINATGNLEVNYHNSNSMYPQYASLNEIR